MAEFMFATGIECSCPTIDGGRWRLDELEATDHYRYWWYVTTVVTDLTPSRSPEAPPSGKLERGINIQYGPG